VAKKTRKEAPKARAGVRKRIWLLAVVFLLVEIVVLPGAESPFRAPKTVLAVIAILAVAGLSLAGQLRRGRIELRWSPLAGVLVALPVIQALSMLWSGNARFALTSSLHSAVWIAGAFWIATVSARERLRLIDAAAIGAAVSGLVLVAQAAGKAVFALGPTGPSGRLVLTGLTGNPANLAMAAVLLLPLVLAAPGTSKRPVFRWILAVALTAAAVISQTMTALVALALVWAVWLIQQRSRRLWIGAAATAVVLVTVALATGLDTRLKRQLVRLERGDWYFLLSARSDGWSAAAEMVRSHPVTGTGAANFTHAYYPSRIAWLDRTGTIGHRAELATHFSFAHCDPLQMVAELGVPGLIWMLALVLAGLRNRTRGDPVAPLFAAAFIPFALLHFPTHLAVGLLPVVLALGHGLSGAREVVFEPGPWMRRLVMVATVVIVLFGCYWQLHRLMVNLWRGGLDHALATVQQLDEPHRAARAAAVEAQVLPRIPALHEARPWMWRMVGQARVARDNHTGAEIAFRNAMALWPHEEAEFGLGLALAAQDRELASQGRQLDTRNRRGEAIVHLARVCRTNPALLELIDEEALRTAVAEIVDASAESTRNRRR
jgi:O-antigen ligase